VTKKPKRAPGGGRKASGPFQRNTAQLPVRMPEGMRGELETAAHKRGWNLTQELLWRVRGSLSKEREEHRDRALRALCFVISEMALKYFSTEGRQIAEPWHRDPFTFTAFKLAVGKLLDALRPPGDLRRPRLKDGRWRYGNETPQSIADHAAKETLSDLFYTRMPDRDMKAIIQSMTLVDNPHWGEWLAEVLERDFYAMSDARRDLGIDEPGGTKP
jgi:hypothetical protein